MYQEAEIKMKRTSREEEEREGGGMSWGEDNSAKCANYPRRYIAYFLIVAYSEELAHCHVQPILFTSFTFLPAFLKTYTVENLCIRTNKERQNIQIIEQLLSFPLNFIYSSRNEEKWRFLSNGSRIFSAVKSHKFFTASNRVELRPRCASNRRTIHHDIFLLISSHFHHFLKIFNNWNYTSTCHLDSPLHTESIRLRLTQVEHSIYLNTLYLRCNL